MSHDDLIQFSGRFIGKQRLGFWVLPFVLSSSFKQFSYPCTHLYKGEEILLTDPDGDANCAPEFRSSNVSIFIYQVYI